MISDAAAQEAYVWIWLPGAHEPVVAGLLSRQGKQLVFNYGRSYLARPDRMSIYDPELPLQTGVIPLPAGMSMPSSIRDASPDAWGRRVIIHRKLGFKGAAAVGADLDELTYLLESGSDRIGALDFQTSPTQYTAREGATASLEELMAAAEKIERGISLPSELERVLQHGTSLGGARPKVLIRDGGKKYIAKFSASNDLYNVVKAEFMAMRLAASVGLDAAPVRLAKALGKDVLLIERFDRIQTGQDQQRRAMVSALTLLSLDEMMAAYASYETLAEIIRFSFAEPKATLRELYGRIVFNILCGNTDDHARNHAAFWDGQQLRLTPAYDICPQARSGQEASQAMLIQGRDRRSQIATCVQAAHHFLLSREEAAQIAAQQVRVIQNEWEATCDEADLSEVDRHYFWQRQFLNPFAFYDAPPSIASI
jgi:serine/threonine-protein kinase HipA